MFFRLRSSADSQYEDMFENGNYRRRRRMKRPYRNAPFGRMISENFATANYSRPSPFGTQSPYVPYPRYESAGSAWMATSGHLTNYSPCTSRNPVYPYSSPLPQPSSGMTINTYGSLANNIGEFWLGVPWNKWIIKSFWYSFTQNWSLAARPLLQITLDDTIIGRHVSGGMLWLKTISITPKIINLQYRCHWRKTNVQLMCPRRSITKRIMSFDRKRTDEDVN